MAFLPIIKILDSEVYLIVVAFIPVPILFLILNIRDFRHNSLTKVKKKNKEVSNA
jgi:hypothetical protein